MLAATNSVKQTLRRGQLIVLESTTYPGTTREMMLPLLEATGLKVGEDFFLAFSARARGPRKSNLEYAQHPKVVGRNHRYPPPGDHGRVTPAGDRETGRHVVL